MFHFSWRGGEEITVSLLMWAQYHALNKPVRLHGEHFQSCYSKKVPEDGRRPNFVKRKMVSLILQLKHYSFVL